jgi:hypothetical protein
VNGGSFAGADLGERATALDVIPADALAAIEVTKVPTPDMDGEGLGGQVNIKTKSPFEADGLAASFTTRRGSMPTSSDVFSSKFNGSSSPSGSATRSNTASSSPRPGRSASSARTMSRRAVPGCRPRRQRHAVLPSEELEFRDYVINRDALRR